MSEPCLSFSGCWRSNANGRLQNALPVLYHKGNVLCYSNSHKNCASLPAMPLFHPCFFWHSMKLRG